MRLCDANAAVQVCADGMWNKTREARDHCLAIHSLRLPLCLIMPQKNVYGETISLQRGPVRYVLRMGDHSGSSKGMEAAAWQQVAANLDLQDTRFRALVSSVCVDRDASVTTAIKV